MDGPALASCPYIVVWIACPSCRRRGSHRLARLADRLGAEATMAEVLAQLSTDCRRRSLKRFRGAHPHRDVMLPDLGSPRPPDLPPAMATPRLKIVGGRG